MSVDQTVIIDWCNKRGVSFKQFIRDEAFKRDSSTTRTTRRFASGRAASDAIRQL